MAVGDFNLQVVLNIYQFEPRFAPGTPRCRGLSVTKAPAKEDTEVTVEISDNVQVKVVKGTLSEVRAKTQPVDTKSDKS